MATLWLYGVGFIILIVLLSLLKQFLPGEAVEYPYQRADALYTSAERSFLGVLEQAVGDSFRIYGKVRLADVIRPAPGLNPSRRQTALNRITSKHVDFVLCEPRTLQIVGVIELDDISHQRLDRQQRDRFVNKALAAAGVPILRVAVQRAYNVADVCQQVITAFGSPQQRR